MTADRPDQPPIQRLLGIMARLRDPETGCPWDIEQNFETIAPYTIEEAYEVADAITRGSRAELMDELGDLLLQVVYHARMAEEEGSFAFDDVATAVSDKMVAPSPCVRRRPGLIGGGDDRQMGSAKGRGTGAQGRSGRRGAPACWTASRSACPD